MSWASKKWRWLKATERAFKRLDTLSATVKAGKPVGVVELDELARTFVELGRRGVQLHPGGGVRYRRGVETKTLQIEAAIRLLRDVAAKRGVPLLGVGSFEAPWVPREDEGRRAAQSLDDLRADFGLDEEES